MTLGEKIERLLGEQKRTQKWLADEVSVSPNSIFKIIGGGDTSYRIAVKIAATFGEKTSWLLDDSLGWEQRSGHESSIDLAGVSDLDLVRVLEARVKRSEAAYAKALKTLKEMPTSKEGSCSPDQEQALRDALARSGYDGRIYLGLLHVLLKLQECLAQTGKERLRLFHVDLISPEVRDALNKMFQPSEEVAGWLSYFKKLSELPTPLSLLKPKKSKRKPRS